MCGRFAQPRSAEDLARLFRARAVDILTGERFNVAPTDPIGVVVERAQDRTVEEHRWGLVPHWAANLRDAARRINARAETVETSATYRSALERKRCIIPADAFYEWRHEPGAGRKLRAWPFAVERVDDMPMAMAGLRAGWRDPVTGDVVRTATILTTVPNELVATIHHRMPVILPPEDWDAWLAEDTPMADVRAMLVPIPAEGLRMRPVSPAVNDVRNDGPELLRTRTDMPATEPLLPSA
jgi:putative SOS response-associated peptidase YedK